MDWRVEKNECVERKIIGGDGERYNAPQSKSTNITAVCFSRTADYTADTVKDAKYKAEKWGLDTGESIGNWSYKQDSFWATISTPNPKIKKSVLHLFIRPEIVIPCIWKKGLIIRDDLGKEVTNQMKLTDRTTGKEIKRYVEIENGKVIRKPEDIDILGEETPKGFVLRGIALKDRHTNSEPLEVI